MSGTSMAPGTAPATSRAPGVAAATGRAPGIDRRDLLLLGLLLVLAALLRLPELAGRGTWDADQGHDMLVLRALVRDGILPLLGPPTSIGDFHHGAWYYYLLAPAAAIGGGDSPLAVVGAIALAGIGAVGVTWWLARSIGGSVAAGVAGLAMAVSTAAVDELTFIWNPNLIALSSSIALAGAWRAWSTRSARWWWLAAVGTAITMQCHVLGVILLPVVAALFVADLRRRAPGSTERGAVMRAGVVGLVIILVAYVPLAIHELTSDFSETRAALDYVAGGREAGTAALPIRLGIVGLRVVSWPLVGLITAGFLAAVVATCAVVGIVVWRWRSPSTPPGERVAVRWLGLGLLWSIVALTVAAPSLASVVPGLPNDHYHAFADPMVFVLVGLGVAALVRGPGSAAVDPARGGAAPVDPSGAAADVVPGIASTDVAPGLAAGPPISRGSTAVAPALAILGVVALVGWNVTHLPPAPHPDGGFPAAAAAADRVSAALRDAGVGSEQPVLLRSLPTFKSTEAMAYPLVRVGQTVVAETPQGYAPGSAVVSAGVRGRVARPGYRAHGPRAPLRPALHRGDRRRLWRPGRVDRRPGRGWRRLGPAARPVRGAPGALGLGLRPARVALSAGYVAARWARSAPSQADSPSSSHIATTSVSGAGSTWRTAISVGPSVKDEGRDGKSARSHVDRSLREVWLLHGANRALLRRIRPESRHSPARPLAPTSGGLPTGRRGADRDATRPRRESRTPAPQTPAFAVPETRTVEGCPGRALESS